MEVVEAVACRVESVGDGPHSRWNLDGELLTGTEVTAAAQLGLLQVFARGPEK